MTTGADGCINCWLHVGSPDTIRDIEDPIEPGRRFAPLRFVIASDEGDEAMWKSAQWHVACLIESLTHWLRRCGSGSPCRAHLIRRECVTGEALT
jgi:hypothetical protein